MKALVYMGPEKLELQDRQDPQDEIVIKVSASGVCGTDLKTYLNGHHLFPPNTILGHECYGEIVRVARHVKQFRIGDRVVVAPYYDCGECELCRKGIGQFCRNKKFISTGCFAEYVAVSAEYAGRALFKIPEPNDVYTLVEPLACVINGMEKLDLSRGRRVLVVGSGPMGALFALAFAKMEISADIVEVSEWRSNKMKEMGFQVIAPNEVEKEIYDQIVLTVNHPELVQFYLSRAVAGGNLLLFSGFSKKDRAEIDPYDVHYREVSLTGSFGYQLAHFAKSLQMIEQDKSRYEQMITHSFGIEDGEKAFRIMKTGETMKLILKP